MGDYGRILEYIGNNQQLYHCSRIGFTANLQSSPAVQKLTGFFDVSDVSDVDTPKSLHPCVIRTP
jgi:hypothetical protein